MKKPHAFLDDSARPLWRDECCISSNNLGWFTVYDWPCTYPVQWFCCIPGLAAVLSELMILRRTVFIFSYTDILSEDGFYLIITQLRC